MTYEEFLAQKAVNVEHVGFSPTLPINSQLFPFQRDIVTWALKRGKAAIFAECGMGKTPMQLEWARHVVHHTGRSVLVLAPLAVAGQTVKEGGKFGIAVRYVRSNDEIIEPGIWITNYDMLKAFDTSIFGGVVLDESSILKSFSSTIRREVTTRFHHTPFKLACTATPAPNDHEELGNHLEFLNVMDRDEMLVRYFVHDSANTSEWRLKGHAVKDFWRFVASSCVCLSMPSDLGYSDDGFVLPPLNIIRHIVKVDHTAEADGRLFRSADLSSTSLHVEMRLTASDRADEVKRLVDRTGGQWVIWCNTDYEADALMERFPTAVEVRGPMSVKVKEERLLGFSAGAFDIIITKPSIAGFGLNWQHCHNMAFVGLSYSYEQLYQAIRRSWRFGQDNAVNAHIVVADTEGPVLEAIQRKQEAHERMKAEMVEAMREVQLEERRPHLAPLGENIGIERGIGWELRLGDSCKRIAELQDETVGLSVFSPPFSNLYIYSDHPADMGNNEDDQKFFEHFKFLIPHLLRVTKAGRLCVVHCSDLPSFQWKGEEIGLKDLPGGIISSFVECGWIYHSRVTIWKDPVVEMQRTKALGLLHKQLKKNAAMSRQGMPDYLVVFRKPGVSVEPVSHTNESFPVDQWQKWASPVWMDINQTDVLNAAPGREFKDEKHLCPLQLDVIERCITLWSNHGDLVLSPFAGIGSEGYEAVRLHRRFTGIELKRSYFDQAVRNLKYAEHLAHAQMTIFDTTPPLEVETQR